VLLGFEWFFIDDEVVASFQLQKASIALSPLPACLIDRWTETTVTVALIQL
jgi:hypothetical protein